MSSKRSTAQASSSHLVTRLLSTFHDDEQGTQTPRFLSSLAPAERRLVASSFTRASHASSRIDILRALWTYSPLHTFIIHCFLSHDCSSSSTTFTLSSSSTAHKLLDEIGFLLVTDARNQDKSTDLRLNSVSHIAFAITKHAKAAAKLSPFHVPALVLCARAALVIASHRALRVYHDVLNYSLLLVRSSRAMYSLQQSYLYGISALLDAELAFTMPQHISLVLVVHKFITSSFCADSSHVVLALTKSLLNHASCVVANGTQDVTSVFTNVLHLIKLAAHNDDLISDMLVVIEVSLQDHPNIIHPLIDSFTSLLYPNANVQHSRTVTHAQKLQFTQTHLLFLFALMKSIPDEQPKSRVDALVLKILSADDSSNSSTNNNNSSNGNNHHRLNLDFSQLASSSSASRRQSKYDTWKHSAIQYCMQNQSIQVRTSVILPFFFTLVTKKSKLLSKWSMFAIIEICSGISSSREMIFRHIFQALIKPIATTNNGSHTQHEENVENMFATLLVKLGADERTKLAFVQCNPILIESLKSFTLIPIQLAVKILPTFIPTAVVVTSLLDALFIFLRKISSSKSHAYQYIASIGFVNLLKCNNVTRSIADETINSLNDMFDVAQPFVRSTIIRQLLIMISNREFPFSTCQALMQHMVSRIFSTSNGDIENEMDSGNECNQRNQVLDSSSMASYQFNISLFFTFEDGKYFIRYPVPLLIRLCAAIKQHCPMANSTLFRFIQYVEREDGALYNACSTSDQFEIPILLKVMLFCSLIQTTCLFANHSQSCPSITTACGRFENQLLLYGTGIVVRDFLLLKEGNGLTNVLDTTRSLVRNKLGHWSYHVHCMTAREGKCSRDKNMKINYDELYSLPMQNIVYVLKSLTDNSNRQTNRDEQHGGSVFLNVVKCEIIDTARKELNLLIKSSTSSTSTSNIHLLDDANETYKLSQHPWSKDLLHCLQSAFVETCPWVDQDYVHWDIENHSNGTSAMDIDDLALNNDNQMNKEQGKSRINLVSLIKKLQSTNSRVEKAFLKSRMRNVHESNRMSIRESCMKIILMLVTHEAVDDEWSLIKSICEESLATNGHASNEGNENMQLTNNNTNAMSTTTSEKDNCSGMNGNTTTNQSNKNKCIEAIHLVTKLFKNEFEKSMSVNLTQLYLELFYVLLDRSSALDTDTQTSINSEISSTITYILCEFSIQNVTLVRHMIKILLRSYNEEEAIDFGNRVLEWLGNHAALVESQYCGDGGDDQTYARFCPHEFDRDILEDAFRMDNLQDMVDDEEDLGNDTDEEEEEQGEEEGDVEGDNEMNSTNKQRPSKHKSANSTSANNQNDKLNDMCPVSSSVADVNEFDPVRSLCLNETADGAIASIHCVMTQYVDIVHSEHKVLKQTLRGEDHYVNGRKMSKVCVLSQSSERVLKMAHGLATFVKSEFVMGCISNIPISTRGDNNVVSISAKDHNANNNSKKVIKVHRKRIDLNWPVEMQRRFALLLQTLTEVVDAQLRLISAEMLTLTTPNTDGKAVIGNDKQAPDNENVRRRNNSRISDDPGMKDEDYVAKLSRSCCKVMELLFEEESVIVLMQNITKEWSRRWVIEEKIENVATSLVAKYTKHKQIIQVRKKKKKVADVSNNTTENNNNNNNNNNNSSSRPRTRRQSSSMNNTNSMASSTCSTTVSTGAGNSNGEVPKPKQKEVDCSVEQDDLDKVVQLTKKLLCSGQASVAKRRRIEWLKKHSSASKDEKASASNKAKGKSSKASGSSGSVKDQDADVDVDDKEDSEGESENLRFLRTSKKYRMRSRNAWVDQYMLEDKEQESYADLEGFLADMNEELT